MKKQDRLKAVRFAGWGHYKVTIEKYGKLYSAISTNSEAVDRYRDGRVNAAIELYDEVIRKTIK